jgi:hypothetical protein
VPHVSLVPFTGLRVGNEELADLGVRFLGLTDRAAAVAELPAIDRFAYLATDSRKLLERIAEPAEASDSSRD